MFRPVYPPAVKMISASEGIGGKSDNGRFYPYRVSTDPPGVMTIYKGHVVKPGENFELGITALQGEELFMRDLADHSKFIQSDIGASVKLSDWMYGAFASFAFNLGPRIFATESAAILVELLRQGKTVGGILRMHRFCRSGGRYRDGLFYRRLREIYLALTGEVVRQPHDCVTAYELIDKIEKLPQVRGMTPTPLRQFFKERHRSDLCNAC